MMLVPSLLGMLGERAWNLPGWLDRRLPRVTFDH
jgi:RND superfamily putative drug exporter